MASSINASLTAGLVQTADTSGIINLQSGGTTVATISSTGLTSTGGALNGSLGATTPSTVAATTVTTSGQIFTPSGEGLTLSNDTVGGSLVYGYSGSRTNAATHTWYNGRTTLNMTLDASGNVGIGVTPSAWGAGFKATEYISGIQTSAVYGSGYNIGVVQNAYYNGANWIYKTTQAASLYSSSLGTHSWYTAPSGTAGNAITFTQAMTLDANSILNVGTTTIGGVGGFTIRPLGTYCRLYLNSNGTNDVFDFAQNGTQVGRIQIATTQTFYVTTSDYRLKENIAPMVGALEKVALLKPVTYKWKLDGSDGQGFIAHELAEVIPNSVAGEKDATEEQEYEISPAIPAVLDEEGNEVTPAVEAVMGTRTVPVYQGIDTSFLVATLTAAIQEQQALITSLTARLDEQQAQISVLQGAK